VLKMNYSNCKPITKVIVLTSSLWMVACGALAPKDVTWDWGMVTEIRADPPKTDQKQPLTPERIPYRVVLKLKSGAERIYPPLHVPGLTIQGDRGTIAGSPTAAGIVAVVSLPVNKLNFKIGECHKVWYRPNNPEYVSTELQTNCDMMK
jgi:hypothetical protein